METKAKYGNSDIPINQIPCQWCRPSMFKTDVSFSIIDDDLGQYVPVRLINFCPFCGQRIGGSQK